MFAQDFTQAFFPVKIVVNLQALRLVFECTTVWQMSSQSLSLLKDTMLWFSGQIFFFLS